MAKLGHSRKSLANKIRRSAEHVRKLSAGEAFPGPELQERLAVVLEVNQAIVAEAVERDRWFKKHGKLPSVPDRGSFVSPIEKIWGDLTRDQREEITCLAECLVRRNRKLAHARRRGGLLQ
jgi:hypothetical protein